jgi:hypothetical protein
MIEFSHIKYGVLLAMMAILFGGLMGLSFGCCEDIVKGALKDGAENVMSGVYGGDKAKASQVVKKSWVYMKRAHLHSQTMGVISIAFSLLATWLRFPAKAQFAISILSGLGSLGYGFFWMLSGYLAPGMGSTGAAKESVALIAQGSGGAFFVSGVALFCLLAYRMFAKSDR